MLGQLRYTMASFYFVLERITHNVGEYLTQNPLINGAANHTVHHVYFNYNYGQYFTLWDRIGGSFRQPSEEQYDRSLKNSAETRRKQAKCVEEILKDPLMRDDKSIFLGLKEQ